MIVLGPGDDQRLLGEPRQMLFLRVDKGVEDRQQRGGIGLGGLEEGLGQPFARAAREAATMPASPMPASITLRGVAPPSTIIRTVVRAPSE